MESRTSSKMAELQGTASASAFAASMRFGTSCFPRVVCCGRMALYQRLFPTSLALKAYMHFGVRGFAMQETTIPVERVEKC